MSGKTTTILVFSILAFLTASYVYVLNNPIEISIQATIGNSQNSSTTTSSTTTSSTTTSS